MSKPLILTSPKGTAEYPYLSEPDIAFNPEGLFHTKLVCKKSESETIKKAIDDLIALEVKKQHDLDPKKKITKAPLPYEENDDEIVFRNLSFPILFLPFVSRSAEIIGKK